MNQQNEIIYKHYKHAPSHLFVPKAAYIVTAGTMQKELLFRKPYLLSMLLDTIFEQTRRLGWTLEAWAVMANHYHFVAGAPETAMSLSRLIGAIHSISARQINKQDEQPGRKVWHQYWDTCLTYEQSYFARLNYVHHNPVRHGLAKDARDYPWCSMSWLLEEGDGELQKKVLSARFDRVSIQDDF